MTTFRLVLALSLAALPVSAQEKFTLKQRYEAKGDSATVVREDVTNEDVRLIDPNGKEVQKKTQQTLFVSSFRQDILEKMAGEKPTKISRTYEQANVRIGDRVSDLAFKGKTVLIEKDGAGYRFLVGDKPLEKDINTLANEFDPKKPSDEETEKLFFPAKAVAAGDTWSVDAATVLARVAGNKEEAAKRYDIEKAKVTGKLTKVYKQEGMQFAVVDIEVNIPMKLFAEKFPCKEGAMLILKLTGDFAIDGQRAPTKTKSITIQKGKADILQKDQVTGAIIVFDISNTRTSTTTPIKK